MEVAGQTSSLPTGTVTFVFTDIEDSTGLVLELAELYPQVIAHHRRLVRNLSLIHI